jgi:glutamine amidotransferase
MSVAIVDYKLSNLQSVKLACNEVGIDGIITNNHKFINESQGIILPGVGSFKEAMRNIKNLNLINVLKDQVNSGKPILGICLGMQLLFDLSEEFGNNEGLGILKGRVKKFSNCENSQNLKINIGWKKIYENKSWKKTLFDSLTNGEFMYFVHSFYVEPLNRSIILSKTNFFDYSFCSAIESKNIFATQFHPEKSGKNGLKIYENFKKNLL